MPAEFAFCAPDPKAHVTMSKNRNPHLAWSDAPPTTRSYALICHDPDVPSKGDDVNQEGRSISKTLPRVDFFHWVLVDIPGTTIQVQAGEYSSGIATRGKPGPDSLNGARQGLNDYTAWFESDPAMKGKYFGYDGPCPPWNDEIPHRYVFTIYALDFARCPVGGAFTGKEVLAAIKGHVLDQATLTGIYSLNPQVRL
jgi:Raf kinase inhibitor-like YbhB/YbcL family protein